MRHLFIVAGSLVAGLFLGAHGAGCGAHEGDCRLNPYACPGGNGGAGGNGDAGGNGCVGDACCPPGLACGPCERCGPSGGCEPLALASNGDCDVKATCAADLQCKKKNGEPCFVASECASGACGDDTDVCVACASDADCARSAESPHCHGGWCKRPDGASCLTDLQCLGDRCFEGACAPCAQDADCASGACDDAAARCLLDAGEPCQEDTECAGNKCSGAFICVSP